jgi:aquaporin Z
MPEKLPNSFGGLDNVASFEPMPVQLSSAALSGAMSAPMRWRSFVAEGVGTFVVMFFGALAVVAAPDSTILESLGFALGLFVAGYAFGAVSHRHFNPAMSWAAFLDGRLSWCSLGWSWVAQLAGGVAAAALLLAMAGSHAVATAATTTNTPSVSFLVETTTSTVFTVVVLVASRFGDRRTSTVLAMSVAYLGVHVVGLPWGGGSINPARSLGPWALAGGSTGVWVFLAAPMVGGVLGWALYRLLQLPALTAAAEQDD